MKLRKFLIFLFLLLGVNFCEISSLLAVSKQLIENIPLQNGPNSVDLNGDGQKDLVFLSHRENFNAHSFETLTIYMQGKVHDTDLLQWQIVPWFSFYNERPQFSSYSEKEIMTVFAMGGADCRTQDFRLARVKQGAMTKLWLIQGRRDLKKTYADEEKVSFEVYELQQNKSGEIGRPIYFFEYVKSLPASKQYCDVNDAFKELGL